MENIDPFIFANPREKYTAGILVQFRQGEENMSELLIKNEVYGIIGAALEVYNPPGSGFLAIITM
jgi:hypothetical protein